MVLGTETALDTEVIYPPFPNKFERALILQMSRKVIKFDTQSVYSNRLSFKRSIKFLHDLKLVLWKENHGGNEYKLTDTGERIASLLRDFYEYTT